MKIGLSIASGASITTSYTLKQWVDERIVMVRHARDCGFKIVSTGQHFLSRHHFLSQPIPLLARLAPESGDMLLMTGVLLLPLYNPCRLAEEMCTLDAITGGRFAMAVGVGYVDSEFEMFGVRKQDRGARQREAILCLKQLLGAGKLDFEGKHYQFHDVKMYTRPVQKGGPPIWIGSGSQAGIRRAAEVADGLYIGGYPPLSAVERNVNVYREHLARLGKPTHNQFALRREVYFDKDYKTALRRALPEFQKTLQAYREAGLETSLLPENLEHAKPGEMEIPFILGSPEECVEQIRTYQERLGVTHMIFRMQVAGLTFKDVLKNMDTFGAKVLPHFHKN